MCFLYTEPIQSDYLSWQELLQERFHMSRTSQSWNMVLLQKTLLWNTDVKVRFNFIVLIVQIYLFFITRIYYFRIMKYNRGYNNLH